MSNFPIFLLFLALITGQLIKIPLVQNSGPTLIDLVVLILDLWGLFYLNFKFKKTPLWLTLGFGFVFICILSLILTPLKLSFGQYLSSALYIGRLFIYLLLGWIVYCQAFKSLSQKLNHIFIFSGILIALLGLFQLLFIPDLSFLASDGWDPHYFRLASTLLDPNFTGNFLVLTLLLLIGKKEIIKPKLWIISFILVYLASLFTFSRGTALLLGASFTIFSLLSRSTKTFLLTIVLSAGFLVVFNNYNQIVAKPRNIDRQQSAEARLDSWQQGWAIFTTSPILGVGFNNYRYALDQYKLAPTVFTQSRGASGNDSSLLFVAATTGIFGLITFLAFIISLLVWSFKNYKIGNHQSLILFSGLSGLLVSSFFLNSLFYPWIFLWIMGVAAQSSTDKHS